MRLSNIAPMLLCICATAIVAAAAFAPILVPPIFLLVGVIVALIILGLMRPTLRIKPVWRFDEIQRHFRLFRLIWERGTVGDGEGYSAKLAVGLRPKLFQIERGFGFLVTILGLRIHYHRSYGGIFA